MYPSLFSFFTDPVLRGPTLGTMLICMAAALVGVLLVLRKQSLVGEALSHAAYPGLMLAVLCIGTFFPIQESDGIVTLGISFGALGTALLGLWCISFLTRLKIPSDAAFCLVLASFFGIGLTLVSRIQFTHTSLYRQAQTYLYGQAATMNDHHILVYAILACLVLLLIRLFQKELQIILLNPGYAETLGIPKKAISALVSLLAAIAVVIGIRSVGVVLMSAMLIAPAVTARQYTHHFSKMLFLSGGFGLLAGLAGNCLSVWLTHFLSNLYPTTRIGLPTGPMIVLVSSSVCAFALLTAPERGLLQRLWRAAQFQYRRTQENVLKMIWRISPDKTIPIQEIATYHRQSSLYLRFILLRLIAKGWLLEIDHGTYRLTDEGKHEAMRIVRLHRLWELYLADYLGVGVENVHRNAEEMEHVITPEIEQQLTLLLNDPLLDPHHQIIPRKRK